MKSEKKKCYLPTSSNSKSCSIKKKERHKVSFYNLEFIKLYSNSNSYYRHRHLRSHKRKLALGSLKEM